MSDITVIRPLDPETELDKLAERYRRAGRGGIEVLNLVGARAESLLDRLPAPVRGQLDIAAGKALTQAMAAADRSRDTVSLKPAWMKTALTTAMGAAGGFTGLPGALVELPITTTVLLRAIQDVAEEQGFDPAAENVKFDCIQVFAAAGPLAEDDGADLGFLTLRLTLSGGAMQKLVTAVAPRLAAVMGQKLAAQAVPVLGAAAGAATNYAYTSYYQQIAKVHFGLRRLAIDADIPHADLVEGLRVRLQGAPVRHSSAE